MKEVVAELRKIASVAVVGGSDFAKAKEQLGEDVLSDYDWVFSENGTVAFCSGKELESHSLGTYLGEEKLQRFLNSCLGYLAKLSIPIKRGTFIEFRRGMINVSPIGRNCSYDERLAFYEYDNEHKVREKMINYLKEQFSDLDLVYSIGGQISFDVFPRGWDKTFCLTRLEGKYKTIHFFGDKTSPGGNDFEIFCSVKTIGHTVTDPADTIMKLKHIFSLP